MNTVVNKLLDVDKQARMILDEAQQYYDRTILDIESEKKKLMDEYEKKAQTHLEEIKRAETASVAENVAEIKNRYEKMTADIDKTFDEKHSELENKLFDKCVGR